jgi:hypothetical protein
MKNKSCTFASSKQRTILMFFVCVAIFIATNTAIYADNIRLSISNSCCASKPVIVLCKTGKDSLSSYIYLIFHLCKGQ